MIHEKSYQIPYRADRALIIMGYKNRSDILKFKNSLNSNPPFCFDCMIIYNGQIIGTWKRTIEKKKIELQYNFFKSINNTQKKAFDNSVKRFEEFNNLMVNY